MSENDAVIWSKDICLKWSDFQAESNPAIFEDSHSSIKYKFTWIIDSDKQNDKIVFLIDKIIVTVEFNPLESGKWYEKDLNEFEIIPDQEDIQYKQGFYKQMLAFGNLIKTKTKVWPLSDLDDSYNTMKLAESCILND